MNIPIPFPLAGVVLDPPTSGQPPGTSREITNMRGVDPLTLQSRGAQRAGHSRFLDGVLGAGPVRDMTHVVTDVPRITYSQNGYSDLYPITARWTMAPEKGQPIMAAAMDLDKTTYVVNQIGGVFQINSSGEVVRSFALPGLGDNALQPAVAVRRMVIDEVGALYFAMNGAANSRLFRYTRVAAEKGWFERTWTYELTTRQIVDFDVRNGDIAIMTQGGGDSRLIKLVGPNEFEPIQQFDRDVGSPNGWAVRLGSQGALYLGIRNLTDGTIRKYSAGGDLIWSRTGSGSGDAILLTDDNDVITVGRKVADDVVCRKIVDHGTTFSVDAGTQSTGTLTFTGVGVDGETITITGPSGRRVYTLKAVIDNAIADQVLIGATATATGQNFSDSLNRTPGLATFSDATTINLDVLASALAGAVTVTARVAGVDGDSIATTTTSAAASWGAGALSGGVDGDGAWVGEDAEDLYAVSGFHASIEKDGNGDIYFGIADFSVDKHFEKRGGEHGYTLASFAIPGGTSQGVNAVALPPRDVEPNYHTLSVTGPRYISIGLSIGVPGTDNPVAYRLDMTTARHDAGEAAVTRRVVYVGVCGGNFITFERGGIATTPTGGSGVISDDSIGVSMAVSFGKVYFTDGLSYWVYDPEGFDEDPRRDNVQEWKAEGIGEIPERAKLLCSWAGRLVIARTTDDPHVWAMSAKGDPLRWEFFAIVPTVTDATIGSDSRYGPCPDIINALIPYSDDALIVGGDSTLHQFTGDPGLGNGFRLLSDVTGIAYGTPWCKDESGILYFFGSRGGVYAMAPGGIPEKITTDTIDSELASIDLAANRIRMVWHTELQGLMLYVCPIGTPDTETKHWCWERHRGWFADTFATADVSPTCVTVFDGDNPDDRVVALGCFDGHVRFIDRTALTDDGERIVSAVLIGPIVPQGTDREMRFNGFQACLASNQDGCDYEFLVGDAPDALVSVDKGRLSPGLNPMVRVRARGNYVAFRLYNGSKSERFAIESLNLDGSVGARRRARAS